MCCVCVCSVKRGPGGPLSQPTEGGDYLQHKDNMVEYFFLNQKDCF